MPLGLARDSMLDLAEMAKKVDDGEYKTSIEISEVANTLDAESSDNLMDIISPTKGGGIEYSKQTKQPLTTESNNGSCSSTSNETPSATTAATAEGADREGETKTPDPFDDTAVNDEDERASIANSSIDSDIALRTSTPAVPASSLNGDSSSSPSKAKTATTTTTKSSSTSSSNNYGRYSGFHAVDYYDDYYQQQDYTAYSGKNQQVPNLLAKNDSKPLWCCFFPWKNPDLPHDMDDEPATLQQEQTQQQQQQKETLVDVNTTPPNSAITRTSSKEEDDRSIGSDAFGERLSDKDRQAVLARLRLAQPDEVTTTNGDSANATSNNAAGAGGDSPSSPDPVTTKKGLLNGISLPSPEVDTAASGENTNGASTSASRPKPPRGILRQHSRMSRNNLLSGASSQASAGGRAEKRRSLFPSYSDTPKMKKDVNVNFSPMARVLSVKSHKDMDREEKGSVWWQKSDYEEFRKTGRMITKAMLEGGSEIWLATNRSWQMPNQARSTTLKHATSLSERQAAKKKGQSPSKKDYENTRDKWWHKFGHSRRGLEHIASIDEGRQRQQNVKRAIRAVVEENKRQKAFLRVDADKLRMVSLQQTTWARDLAMAAGASDADAVHTNFNDESRKSREFYLLKFSRAQQSSSASSSSANNSSNNKGNSRAVPAFMRPATSLQVQPNRLDANTMSQIRYRQSTSNNNKKNKVAPTSSSQPRRASTRMPLKDAASAASAASASSSMAKKAAGFASGDEVANMSAVLSGMGPLPKNATMVGGP